MDICEQSQLAIVSALKEAIGHYAAGEKDSVITDIHLLPRQDSAAASFGCHDAER